MAKSDEDWDEEEINICVEQYVAVLKLGGATRAVSSKDVFAARAEKQLSKRNAGAVARRMCNISAVLEELGGQPVMGWKPQTHVGPTNTARIAKALKDSGVI